MNAWRLGLLFFASVACGARREPSSAPGTPEPVSSNALADRREIAELRSLWPAAMKAVETTPPVVDLSAWQPAALPMEAALFVPESSECSSLIISQPDAEGATCRVVTQLTERDGRRYRVSVDCSLSPDLVIDYGHQREEVLVDGKWEATEEGMAVPIPQRTYGLLTSGTTEQLTYGGERVTPVEGCVGDELRHCSDVSLPIWLECRACDKTELFFVPRPKDDAPLLQHWPECLSQCPKPPHRKRLEGMGELGLWRKRADESVVPRIFRDPAACLAHLGRRAAAPTNFNGSK